MANEIFDERFHDLVATDEPVLVGDDLGFTEGPVMTPGGYMLFSDVSGDRIMRWSRPDRGGIFRQQTGNANGNTLDLQGRLITCEVGTRRVTRTEHDGTITVIADSYEGRRLNAPNDVVVKSDGSIFFTDPVFLGANDDLMGASYRSLDFCGVFRISPAGEISLVTAEVDRPNGLAFSADESLLYIVNTPDNTIYAFDIDENGKATNKRKWLEMQHDSPGVGDGMKVDTAGNVYCTGPGGVWVASSDGTALGIIRVPKVTTNLAFYCFDSLGLFITAPPSVYFVKLRVAGISVTDRIA